MNVTGTSVSGIGTRLYVPEIDLTFDMGSCSSQDAIGTSNNVCLTHGHMDHIGQAAYLRFTRELMGMEAPHFFLPEHLEGRFRTFMAAAAAMEENFDDSLTYNVTVVKPGQKCQVKPGLWIQPLASPHTIPMCSYVVWKDTKKLKEEFRSLPGQELGKLRKQGVQIEDVVTNPVFAYTGDTTAKAYEINPILFQVQTLAMEMTFFQDYKEENAAKLGHTHINDVIAIADRFENREIFLVHHSARYDNRDKEKAHSSLPESFRKKSRWL